MNPDFWNRKRVFLTGHTGFKGSWLSLWLRKMGAVVCGYALDPPTEPNLFSVANVATGIEHHRSDIRDRATLSTALQAFAPEIVYHMAAQPIVRASYLIPAETYETNVMGTVNVLDAVRETASVRATIVITSDKCYENRETIWAYRETDAMGGHDPYSSSKGCAELVVAAYGRSFFAPEMANGSIASVRAGNVIGGGDWASDRLMADLARGLTAKKPVVIRRPRAVRPWQHVLDPLSGYLAVAERLYTSGPMACDAWNFGPESGSHQTVENVARLTCELWGAPEALQICEDAEAPHEAGLLTLDSVKSQTYLGWHPRWAFQETIEHTVAWYRAFVEGTDMHAFTLNQIAAFEGTSPLAGARK